LERGLPSIEAAATGLFMLERDFSIRGVLGYPRSRIR